jgi:hypothetical protein
MAKTKGTRRAGNRGSKGQNLRKPNFAKAARGKRSKDAGDPRGTRAPQD